MWTSMNPPIPSWPGQRVWIIGASSGIGAELARQLLLQGANVILSARHLEPMQHLAQPHPGQATIIPLDVTQPADWQWAWAQLQQQHILPDLVIYCAGEYIPEHSWQVDPQQAQHTLNVNLLGVYQGLACLLPHYVQQQRGGIALIASVAGYVGLPGAPVYGPGKAALINLAELLYAELRPKGLSVYLINPGFVRTPLTARNDFAMPALQTPQQAASRILHGLQQGRFEIHFPYRFTLWLKLLQQLPYCLRLPILKRLSK